MFGISYQWIPDVIGQPEECNVTKGDSPGQTRTSFLALLGNFPYRGLPPLYLRKSARFLGQCTPHTVLMGLGGASETISPEGKKDRGKRE
jgi:hypothetical protein